MNATELREQMAALPEPVTDKVPPYWEYWRHELWNHVTNGDDPDGFMGWPCIYHTMLVNHWKDAVAVEFERYRHDDRFLDATLAPPHGYPRDWIEGHKDIRFSRNLIHQAYHIKRWEETTGQRVDELESIAEFGGGYGAMAMVCRRLGFKGRYVIYDLPEFALLQQYFLSRNGVEGVEWGKLEPTPPGVLPFCFDLFLALYSLSEIPMDAREPVLDLLPSSSYLFLYSVAWQDYDNKTAFQGLFPFSTKVAHEELKHLPDRNNWYMFAW